MSKLLQFVESELYPALYPRLDLLLPEFDLQHRRGYWQSSVSNKLKTDGSLGSTGGAVYIYENRPGILKSYKASAPSRNLLTYLAERDQRPWAEVVSELAQSAGLSLPYESEEATEQRKQTLRKQEGWLLLESFFHQLLLGDPLAADHRAYLAARGFSADQQAQTALGFFPGALRTRAYLLAAGLDQAQADQLLDSFPADPAFNLAIPAGDEYGRTNGFILRNIAPKNPQDRYRYTVGYEKAAQLFHFNRRWAPEQPLILVEGQLDCLLLSLLGIHQVAALGGSALSDAQLGQLIAHKSQVVVLALDGDEAGKKAAEKITFQLLDSPLGDIARLFLVEFPADQKDANEVFLRSGEAALKAAIQQATPAALWLNLLIIKQIQDNVPALEGSLAQDRYLNEVAKTAARIRQPLMRGQFLDYFLRSAGEDARISRETIEEAAARMRFERQREEELKSLQNALFSAGKLLREGALTEARDLLERKLLEAVSLDVRERVRAYSYQDFLEETAHEPEDLYTGIEGLDDIVRIPQAAVTLIAARPSHGKTTLMLNLFYNMVMRYPDRRFHFFTYEEPAKYLLLKLLNRILYEQGRFKGDIHFLRAYMAGKHPRNPNIEAGRQTLADLINGHRLNLYSYPLNDLQLAEAVKAVGDAGPTGGVFVDYIQKIPVSQQVKGYEVIKQISGTILNKIAVPLQIPVVLGAQFNREARANKASDLQADMLREGGDLEQDASLVLGLLNYNFVAEDDDENGPIPKGEIARLAVRSLKYRNGTPGKTAQLSLHGKYHYIGTEEEGGKGSKPKDFVQVF